MSAAGYSFFLRGDMDLKNLFRLEDLLGLPLARPAADRRGQVGCERLRPMAGICASRRTWDGTITGRARRNARPEPSD